MKFGTIIADPPWEYNRTSGNKKLRGYSDKQYEPLTTDDLANLPVSEIVGDVAVLLLWTNGPFLADGSAQRVAKSWGFKPVSLWYWHKIVWREISENTLYEKATHRCRTTDNSGVGYWARGNCEPILVASRGRSFRWSKMTNWRTEDKNALFEAPKRKHSRKPDDLHERVERGYVYDGANDGYPKPYLEMFARYPRDGWTLIGNEAPGHEGEDIRDAVKRLAGE